MEGSTTTNLSSSSLEDVGGATTAISSCPEESGWTQYLDDFMASEDVVDDGGSSSSLASDAASCALMRKAGYPSGSRGEEGLEEYLGSWKRKKGRRYLMDGDNYDDDPLEDTACSSAISNNPEVRDAEGSDANAEERYKYSPSDDMERSKVSGVAITINSLRSRSTTSGVNGGGVDGKGDRLEQKGLCLVDRS